MGTRQKNQQARMALSSLPLCQRWLRLAAVMATTLVSLLLPQQAWGDPETIALEGKSFYVLKSSSDWDFFRQKVIDAAGASDVNAIMAANFSTGNSCGDNDYPYRGVFDGNGHTLTTNITHSSDYQAPFKVVGNCSIRNLHVAGSVSGGNYSAGLIALVPNTGNYTVNIDRVWSSVNVTSSSKFACGLVGYMAQGLLKVYDCRYDGTLSSTDYKVAFNYWYWGKSSGTWHHRLYENCTANNTTHFGFCYNMGTNNKIDSWGGNDDLYSSHNWSEMADDNHRNMTDQNMIASRMNGSKSNSWQVVDGKAVPIGSYLPEVSFETYDMVPGSEKGEEGYLKIPFSCDQAIEWIEGTYTGEDGTTRTIARSTFGKNTYAGFIMIPATEQHKNLKLSLKLQDGIVLFDQSVSSDAVIHNPRNLTAQMLSFSTNKVLADAGAVELKWEVKDASVNDVVNGDQFEVMRSLTGKTEDMVSVGSVAFESGTATYTFKDETLTSALAAEHIDENKVTNAQVVYLVVRGSAMQLWGLENTTAAKVSVPLHQLHLLRVADYQTAWADQTAKTVSVTWQYADEARAVWDSRSKMNIIVTAINREGTVVETVAHTLTDDEIMACQKVIQLPRSCVNYKIMLDVEQGESAIPVESSYFEIRTDADWVTFCEKIAAAKGQYNVNASLMADINISKVAAYNASEAYCGTFEGNGHTLNVSINDNAQNTSIFSHIKSATIRNLHVTGSITSNTKFTAGLAACLDANTSLLVENCRVSATVTSTISGDATNGGFVAIVRGGASVTLRNCSFDGSFDGGSCHSNGGFVGYLDSNATATIENGLFAPKAINTQFTNCNTWARVPSSAKLTVTNSHCTKEYWSEDDYITISSAADWDAFVSKVEAAGGNSDLKAVLLADITITKPAGTFSSPFNGTFDGNGHTLTANISYTGSSAVFLCTKVCTIKNLHVTGSIQGNSAYVAGLIADYYGSNSFNRITISNCRVSANLSSTSPTNDIGGFIANAPTNLTITNCLFDGKITAGNGTTAAAFAASIVWGTGSLSNSLDNGTYEGTFLKKGMFCDSNMAFTPSNGGNNWSYNGFSGTANTLSVSQLVDKLGSTNWHVEDGKAVPTMNVGLGHLNNGDVYGKTATEMIALLGSDWMTDDSDNATPKTEDCGQAEIENSAKHPFKIHSTADWNAFRALVESIGGQKDIYAELLADIAITEPVSANYRGTFDGNGHTLTCQINADTEGMAPFMNIIGTATIRNLNVDGTIQGRRHSAGIVGKADYTATLTVENCRVSAQITTTDGYAGGIIGHGREANITVRNCLFDGTISGGTQYAGAFIGWSEKDGTRTVENCLDNGTYEGFQHAGANYQYTGNSSTNAQVWGGTNNYTYKDWGEIKHVGTLTTAQLADSLGNQWQTDLAGKVLPKVKGSTIDGMLTFYYENIGHIAKTLVVQTRTTSALLSWANVDDEPVDYYEVWRKDQKQGSWEPIATQITEMQYEDKQTSPVHQYIYKVRGVNSCEGITYDETDEAEGMCTQTAIVEGYLRFQDGSGIPGKTVSTTDTNEKVYEATTDESGFFRLSGLPYKDFKETDYAITTTIMGLDPLVVTFGTAPGDNVQKNQVIEVKASVKLSGYVQYEGTSIPVQGVSFLVDGYEVHTAAGKVTTDHEGKFSFRILPGEHQSIQAVKDGHDFWRKGYYHENDDDPDTLLAYNFSTDKAGLMFYDKTLVKLTGRIVGGKTQGELPLGYGLSRNNLGDDLQMVFLLEGDNASRLVWDIQDRDKKERDEVFMHEAANKADGKYQLQTKVHTTLNRKVVSPDPLTGEYEVWLPPVKWKIQQITARGYATLFQDGQVGDVIDLTDSIKPHKDVVEGEWRTIGYGKTVTNPVEEYYAKYNRIYHSPVVIDYRQQGFGNFDFYGDQYYSYQNLSGGTKKLAMVYGVRKEGWPAGKEDSLEARYTFGHPVFSLDKKYPMTIAATEKYYYNNNPKSDTVDVVRLAGGVVTIHNGMMSATHSETVALDSLGQATYLMEAAQTPYMLTGNDALRTVTMTLEMDSTHYEAKPLKAYVLNVTPKAGAADILSYSTPQLIDILRDPPGGGSKATLSKGSTLKYTYQMDMKWSAGVSFTFAVGGGLNSFTGVVAAPMGAGGVGGFNTIASNTLQTSLDLVWSGSGSRAFNYTMTVNEDISTSTDKTLVAGDGDLYIGVVQNIVVKPATAIRAIPDSAFVQMAGELKAGRMVEIARGYDDRDSLLHFVRDEVLAYGPEIKSHFVHSQNYIVNQLIPELAEQVNALMFTGTEAEAKTRANATKKPVYLSLVSPDHPDFGTKYTMIAPDDATGKEVDEVAHFHDSMIRWIEMIALNEKEKLDATDLVKNFDVDGGSSLSYSETFASDYANTSSMVSPITPMTAGYFDTTAGDIALGIVAIVGPTAAKILGSVLNTKAGGTTGSTGSGRDEDGHMVVEVQALGTTFKFGLVPSMSFSVTPKNSVSKAYNRKESFTIGMDKRSHLDFDVYYVKTKTDNISEKSLSVHDVFLNNNFDTQESYNYSYLKRELEDEMKKDYTSPRAFVYRTRGGATCRPWEGERKTLFHQPGTLLDARTKKIENPQITIDKQSISGVPFGEPARFKLYLTNESEQPEAAYPYFDIYQVEKQNPDGAKMLIDGMPLTGTTRAIEVRPGQVTEKTLEVYAGEVFDYKDLQIGLISQGDAKTVQTVAFDVHYLQTAGAIAITSPGDKWIMNCDAPQEAGKGWYLPIIISGFDKNQHNFDHIEFQYKETTRGDDYWTNLCGYYADSTIYRAASGTKEMIPENGNIVTRFFGEGQEMEKAYDLRAVLFCRNGNAFLTNESKVLSGVKDTRRPKLFGTPEPKDGILGAGENIIFDFSEDIEYNYLQGTTNFEVVGETNETAIVEAPSLQFAGTGYALTETRRNFADKNVTVEMMVKPDDTNEDMPIFSHGSEGRHLQLWITKEKYLKAMVENGDKLNTLISDEPLTGTGFQRVALVLDNENKQLTLYSDKQIGRLEKVTYSGIGQLKYGMADEISTHKTYYYHGRMLQARLWYRALDLAGLNRYGGRMLTGYEMGLADYYPMNDGRGNYAADLAQGAHLVLNGASWAQPEGMALRLDATETPAAGQMKGLQLRETLMRRDQEQDYTLMFWFKTPNTNGTLLANGSGRADDEGAVNKFFIGFENHTLKYRTNGAEYALGDNLCDDAWHHYAMTVNRMRNVASIYIDNELKAQFTTSTLGGMLGTRFFLGNMVWQKEGDPTLHEDNALTGYIDGLALFEQALPLTLIKRYSTKSPSGEERGLLVYMPFERQEQQKSGELTLQPYALSSVVKYGSDGQANQPDSLFADPVNSIKDRIDRNMGAPVQPHEHLRKLDFSFVGRNNQLLVNIDELDARINKQNIYVTVADIPDKNGNFMASPATECFFVNRNPLKWEGWNGHMYLWVGEECQLTYNIVNTGGKAHTYTIENLPRWMTVDKPSDVLEPQKSQEITFTINKGLEVGSYDQLIYLTDEDGMSEPLLIEMTVEGEEPLWIVDQNLKRYSMNVVGQAFVDNTIVTDTRDKVAAFDATGRCMGVSYVKYNAQTGRSMVYMTIYDNTTETTPLFFRLWHAATGKIMQLTTSESIEFGDQAIVGTIDSPIRMTTDDLFMQTIKLEEGWNWISFNVTSPLCEKMSSLLSMIPWKNGDMVTEDTQDLTLVYKNGKWMSNSGLDISRIPISPAYCYRLKVQEKLDVELWGTSLKSADERTIEVKQGWNSIGYTPMINLPVATALTDYFDNATNGDVIKNQHEFAMFASDGRGGGEWLGTLEYLQPGAGYMLHRQKAGNASFCYPYYEPGSTFIDLNTSRATVRDDQPARTVYKAAAAKYGTTMNIVARAQGIELADGDRLVAYADGEKAGEVEVKTVGNAQQLFFLSTSASQHATLSFTIERNGSIIAASPDVMHYQADDISGSLESPTTLHFSSVTGIDSLMSGNGSDDEWWTVQGIKLSSKPTRAGVYIHNGRSHVIKNKHAGQ